MERERERGEGRERVERGERDIVCGNYNTCAYMPL
jgi:hypothetical protein